MDQKTQDHLEQVNDCEDELESLTHILDYSDMLLRNSASKKWNLMRDLRREIIRLTVKDLWDECKAHRKQLLKTSSD